MHYFTENTYSTVPLFHPATSPEVEIENLNTVQYYCALPQSCAWVERKLPFLCIASHRIASLMYYASNKK
jgi:hypothetical protein